MNSIAPRGAQYVDAKHRLVHAIPLGTQLALARSDGTIDVIEEPAAATCPRARRSQSTAFGGMRPARKSPSAKCSIDLSPDSRRTLHLYPGNRS